MKAVNIPSAFIGIIALVILASCSTSKDQRAAGGKADSLMLEYLALQDSVAQHWNVMIEDDDEKLFYLKRLLLEVSYTNNYDKAHYDALVASVDSLKNMRYDQTTMSDSNLIDAYDSVTWVVINRVTQFAVNHPNYQDNPLMEELIGDIQAKNNFVLMHRIHYDNWVKALNEFKRKHRKTILRQSPDADLENMPLFQLPSL